MILNFMYTLLYTLRFLIKSHIILVTTKMSLKNGTKKNLHQEE